MRLLIGFDLPIVDAAPATSDAPDVDELFEQSDSGEGLGAAADMPAGLRVATPTVATPERRLVKRSGRSSQTDRVTRMSECAMPRRDRAKRSRRSDDPPIGAMATPLIAAISAGDPSTPLETSPTTRVTDQRRGIRYGSVDERKAGEVVWTQETEPIGLWATYELPTLQPAA